MKCKNCGQKLNDGDLFCGNCGAPVPSGHSSKKVVYIVIAVAVILAIAAGVILALTIGSDSSDDSKPVAEIQSDTDSSKDSEADTYTGEEEDATGSSNTTGDTDSSHHADGSESEHPFTIDPESHADYTASLDPSEYAFYSSEISEFNFWYPTEFYNHVTYNTTSFDTTLGTSEEEITFTAEDSSQLMFRAIRRTDSMNLDEMTNTVYTSELGLLSSSEVILNTVTDGAGKIIVTGWDKTYPDNTVYSLTKVKSDYILQMKVVFPEYTNANDEHQKGYLTECYYRMCGFSDADPWRTYDEYLSEVN